MSVAPTPSGARLLGLWRRLSSWPGGPRLFGWILGRQVPYSGSVRPRIVRLEPGYARVRIRERRELRNHLSSIHALALANVGELASGLAMTTALPDSVRGIVTGIEVDYLKKARGTITAESRCRVPEVRESTEHRVEAMLTDETGDAVSRVRVSWLLSPREPQADHGR